jgi:hypothetical protein
MRQRWVLTVMTVLVPLTAGGCASAGVTVAPSVPSSPVKPASAVPVASPTRPAPKGCASQSYPAGFEGRSVASSIIVCPARAPVGAVVHITLQGCDAPPRVAVSLEFLGPTSFIGSSGGGDGVPWKDIGGDRATATFKIPRSYLGGELGTSPNPTLAVRPGDHYSFATYPAAECDVGFTVTP